MYSQCTYTVCVLPSVATSRKGSECVLDSYKIIHVAFRYSLVFPLSSSFVIVSVEAISSGVYSTLSTCLCSLKCAMCTPYATPYVLAYSMVYVLWSIVCVCL